MAAAMGVAPAATQPDSPSSAGSGLADATGTSAKPTPVATGAPAPTAAPTAKRTLARRALDRVPVKWLSTGLLAVFLAATAAFGGLVEVERPGIPVLDAGETFIGAELEMTPVRIAVLDELRGSGVFPADDERVLTLIMDVQNLSEFARLSSATGSLSETRIEGLEKVAPAIARLDDETGHPWLQPLVPLRVALTWVVPAGAFADGDDVRLLLPTASRYVGQSVRYGVYWTDVAVAAHMNLPVEDLGSGEEAI